MTILKANFTCYPPMRTVSHSNSFHHLHMSMLIHITDIKKTQAKMKKSDLNFIRFDFTIAARDLVS